MAAILQGADALARVTDGHFLRAEVLLVERHLPPPGLRDRPPVRPSSRNPRAVGLPGRVEAMLGRRAAQALEAHVLRAGGALRDEHVAHDALLVDAQRR